MPRARFQNQDDWQTAATSETGSGCLSFYLLPPFAVLVIAGFLTLLALNSPISTSALPMNDPSASNSSLRLSQSETSSGGLSPIFTQEVQYWEDNIIQWAKDHSLDPNLAAVVMQIE